MINKSKLPNHIGADQAYTYLAKYYDQLMNIDYYQWVAYLERIWQSFGIRPANILELACGTGNITIPLAQKGYQVTAVDCSKAMIKRAREKANDAELHIEFIEQDMRTVSLADQFDVVLCCCDSVNYLTETRDLSAFFKQAYLHTRPGGLLLFDLNSELKLREIYGNQFYAELGDDFSYFWDNHFDEQTETCRMELTFFINLENNLYQRVSEIHFEKLWRPQTVFNYLQTSNWQVIGYYGFLTWEEPGSDEERWQFAARKEV